MNRYAAAIAGMFINLLVLHLLLYPNVPLWLEQRGRTNMTQFIDPDDPAIIELTEYISLNHPLDPEAAIYSQVPWCSDFEAWGNAQYLAKPYETLWAGCGDCTNQALVVASVTKRMELLGYIKNPAEIKFQPHHAYTSRKLADNTTVDSMKIQDEDVQDDNVVNSLILFWGMFPLTRKILLFIGTILIWSWVLCVWRRDENGKT